MNELQLKRYVAALATGIVCVTSPAEAAFVLTNEREVGAVTVDQVRYDRIRFYIRNDGLPAADRDGTDWPSTGSYIAKLNVEIASDRPLRWADLYGEVIDVKADAESSMATTAFTKLNKQVFEYLDYLNISPSIWSTWGSGGVEAYASALRFGRFDGFPMTRPPRTTDEAFNYLTVVAESGATVTVTGETLGWIPEWSEVVGYEGGWYPVESVSIGSSSGAPTLVPEPSLLCGGLVVALHGLSRRPRRVGHLATHGCA